ncbi:MAG: hypothetical protein V1914_02035 [archaeon]
MKKLTKILACSLPLLASCYPARMCKQSVDITIYECRIIESFTDQVAGRYWRFTEAHGICTIDGFLDKEYVVLVDKGCNTKVDEYMQGDENQTRADFGESLDNFFLKIKESIGDKPFVEKSEEIIKMEKSPFNRKKSHH